LLTSEVELQGAARAGQLEDAVERGCLHLGLELRFKTSLAKYPGSVHWHFGRTKQNGTLEVTLWEREKSLWLSVHSGRAGAWTDAAMIELKSRLESELGGTGASHRRRE